MGNSYSLFLRQSYLDAWEDYRRSLHRADFPVWDYIILTASNEAQANAYRQQIAIRRAKNLLPERTHYAVLPDPDGLRVGSGGATLNALRYVCTQEGTFARASAFCASIQAGTASACHSTARAASCFRLSRVSCPTAGARRCLTSSSLA